MSNELVTLGTFSTPTEAGFFRSLLEGEGIQAYLMDDSTISMNPILGNTIGWVKLQVADGDVDRAMYVLESRKSDAAEISPEEWDAEALEQPVEMLPPDAAEVPEDPLEQIAARAFRASVIGWAFFPLMVYAVWLLGRLVVSKEEWSPRTSRNAWLAVAVILAGIGAVWLYFEIMLTDPRPLHGGSGGWEMME